MQHPPQVVRVILNAGHGLGNRSPNVYDPGATGCGEEEHQLVARIADDVVDRYYHSADALNTATASVSVIPTPVCSTTCALSHPRASHLAYTVEWINDNAIHDKHGYHDYVISLHMDESPRPASTGTLVVYDNGAPTAREQQAIEVARIVSSKLGLTNRGAEPDTYTQRRSIAIVEQTDPPALLIELGFITNENDIRAVKECGVDAVITAIEWLGGKR